MTLAPSAVTEFWLVLLKMLSHLQYILNQMPREDKSQVVEYKEKEGSNFSIPDSFVN